MSQATAASPPLAAHTKRKWDSEERAAAQQPLEKRLKLESENDTSNDKTTVSATTAAATNATADAAAGASRPRKRRWGDAVDASSSRTTTTAPSTAPSTASLASSLLASVPLPAGVAAAQLAALPNAKALAAALIEKQIQEKLKSLGLPTLHATASTVSGAAPAVKTEGDSTSAPRAFPTTVSSSSASSAWMPLRLDAQGRQIDEQGNVIEVNARATASLKINQRTEEDRKALAAKNKIPDLIKLEPGVNSTVVAVKREVDGQDVIVEEQAAASHFDPRVALKAGERKARAFNFVKPGKYVAQAATLRMKQLEKDLKTEKVDSALPAMPLIIKQQQPPAIEWWDQIITMPAADTNTTNTNTNTSNANSTNTSSDQMDTSSSATAPALAPYICNPDDALTHYGRTQLNYDKLTHYIYHPVEVKSLTEAAEPPPMPVFLTKAERKKIRRKEKEDRRKEREERIRLGLEPPLPSKMRLNNLMNALLSESVADPSALEAAVKKQIAERKEQHEANNAARKLTKEQKEAKIKKKLAEDTSREVHVGIYKCGDLSDSQTRYKVDINCQQWNLYGCAIIHPECNMIVVEGGPKNLRRFNRLMYYRIAWKAIKAGSALTGTAGEEQQEEEEEEEDSDDETGDKQKSKHVHLVWQGIQAKHNFQRFTFENVRSEALARAFLSRHAAEQYWDMCRNFRVTE